MSAFARFSDYDLFAYVASGLAAFVVWDIAFSTSYVLNADWSVASATITVAAAYIIGQILAAPSGWLIERQFVRQLLLRPSVVLMNSQELGWRKLLKRTVLQDYYTPLDPGLRQKVRQRAAVEQAADVSGEALFWFAFSRAKTNPNAVVRMDAFLRQYGFGRNMAFVALTGACLLWANGAIESAQAGWTDHVVQQFQSAMLSILVGLGMLHRYLKFFRLYSVEVFLAYIEAPERKPKNHDED